MSTHIHSFLLVVIPLLGLLIGCEQPETTQAVRKDIEDAVFASGNIEPEHTYTVSAKVDGIVLALPVKEGDSVLKGDMIAMIESDVQDNQLQDALVVYQDAVSNASPNSPQLLSLKTQIEQAEQQLVFDEANYLRYKDLRAKNSVSQLDYEKAELQYESAQHNLLALQKNYQEAKNTLQLSVERSQVQVKNQRTMLKDYRLFTEATGQVISVYKKQGELVRRGEAIARIGSGAYIIKLFVSEDDINNINLGQFVAINLNTYPGESFSAKVTKIYPGFDEIEQSYIVEAAFVELPGRMFAGTQLTGNIETGRRSNILMVPTRFVGKGNRVTLEGGAEKQIVTGNRNEDWTEVVSGISESDILIPPNN